MTRPTGDSPRIVRCPQCGGDSVWSSANPSRPFCSERCKLIDLGAWAAESYRVPVEEGEASPSPLPESPPSAETPASGERSSRRR